MKTMQPILAVTMFAAFTAQAGAAEYSWVPTAASTAYDWIQSTNWVGNVFPNAAGETISITNDIVGAQTIRLQQNIQVGSLNIGEAAASGNNYAFSISSGTGGTGANRLQLRSATADGPTTIKVVDAPGTPGNTISAVVDILPNAPLTVTAGFSQRLILSGGIATNNSVVNIRGGFGGVALNGNLIGSGALNVEFDGRTNILGIAGMKDFTGALTVNRGSVDMPGTAGFPYCPLATVNGYYTYGGGTTIRQNGGVISTGNNNGTANPGQRLPSGTIILNGGSLYDGGQLGNGSWTTEIVRDTVTVVRCNSGYSYIGLEVRGSTAGTTLEIGTLQRTNNATLYARGVTFAVNAKLLFSNSADYLKGAGGAPYSQTMSVIPWIGGRNDVTATATPDGFATYIAGLGLRALTNTEYAASITAGSTYNVSLGTFVALASDTTVNALRLTGGTSTIGTGRTLTITSGALMGGGVIGTPGSAAAGTLNFGPAEGVIWTGYGITSTNVIGAVIAGSGGVTKANTGSLMFTGANTYTGPTTVTAGLLVIGNATYGSKVGNGDVFVSNGSTLAIAATSSDAIADTATVRLAHYGPYFGNLDLATGINETVKYLYLGETGVPAGTYGGTGSGADTVLPDYFTGTGKLTVTHSSVVRLTDPTTVILVR